MTSLVCLSERRFRDSKLATIYTAVNRDIKRIILRVLEIPVHGMGAETLITPIIHILTEQTSPSPELVENALPKLIKLSPPVVKQVFNRLLGLHSRILAQRFQLAKKEALQVLDKLKIPIKADRETLIKIARTCLHRKLSIENGDILTDIVVDDILAINEAGKPIDLNMVEIMEMQHRTEADSRLVRGIVLNHGAHHPSMPKAL
ncbi:unnamed protein product [Rotaria sp. Silwood1]|nr:unnamed protein product [Rotaria sp. Silwood1]CAF1654349.1 unnamed protein product [Rotaria sp. Silwood1]CAF3853152.1 unnamed protein product [Rotaria sp. Silwood1]CAF4611439.1 unnamed protein product [Rotaria sp. Silwood1]CAF4635779.1 unnamed protein product [Rotaria sp. Silwood1]